MSICCKNCGALAAIAKEKEQELVRYRKVFKDIEKYFEKKDTRKTSLFNIFVIKEEILDIINKVKGDDHK